MNTVALITMTDSKWVIEKAKIQSVKNEIEKNRIGEAK